MRELLHAKDWDAVDQICSDALSENSAALLILRGSARQHLARLSEALDDYTEALRIDSENCEALLGLAAVLEQKGSLKEAEQYVFRVLENDIDNREAHELLKRIALVKFREGIELSFASGKRSQLSYSDILARLNGSSLSNEEIKFAMIELLKNWCDRVENKGGFLFYINNKNLLLMLASMCYKIGDLKTSITLLSRLFRNLRGPQFFSNRKNINNSFDCDELLLFARFTVCEKNLYKGSTN